MKLLVFNIFLAVPLVVYCTPVSPPGAVGEISSEVSSTTDISSRFKGTIQPSVSTSTIIQQLTTKKDEQSANIINDASTPAVPSTNKSAKGRRLPPQIVNVKGNCPAGQAADPLGRCRTLEG